MLHVISSSFRLPSKLHLQMLGYLWCLWFLDCLDLKLLFFLVPVPQLHQPDLPNMPMAEGIAGSEVLDQRPEREDASFFGF
jgi:hypothetical protein